MAAMTPTVTLTFQDGAVFQQQWVVLESLGKRSINIMDCCPRPDFFAPFLSSPLRAWHLRAVMLPQKPTLILNAAKAETGPGEGWQEQEVGMEKIKRIRVSWLLKHKQAEMHLYCCFRALKRAVCRVTQHGDHKNLPPFLAQAISPYSMFLLVRELNDGSR